MYFYAPVLEPFVSEGIQQKGPAKRCRTLEIAAILWQTLLLATCVYCSQSFSSKIMTYLLQGNLIHCYLILFLEQLMLSPFALPFLAREGS